MKNTSQSHRIDLSAGPLQYQQIGSDGPVLVFVHGALVDGSIWQATAAELALSHRCIVPTWPLGSHTEAMNADVELSPGRVAELIVEFLDALELDEVTLVANDSGGAICQCLIALGERATRRVAGVVLTNCDAFEVFPPRAFRYLTVVPRVPLMTTILLKELHALPFLGRLPTAFGRLTTGRLDSEVLARWFRPAAKDRAVRRDLKKLLRSVSPEVTLEAAGSFSEFEKPVLMLWGDADRYFTIGLARRLAKAFPKGSLEPIAGARTFVMLDEPREVALRIRRFVAEEAGAPRSLSLAAS